MATQSMDKMKITRRHLLSKTGIGFGSAAMTSLFASKGWATASPRTDRMAPQAPHFAPKAKSVIFLFMAGAPSTPDLLDPKPLCRKRNGEPVPESFLKGERFAFITGTPRLLGSPYNFKQYGQSGAHVSELLPHFSRIVDEVAILRSMHTTQFNHAPGQIYMNTGHQIVGRASAGAWCTYGLGSEAANLPGYVVMTSGDGQPDGGKSLWSSGHLPTVYQGVELRTKGDPVLFLSNPPGVTPAKRRATLDTLQALNRERLEEVGDPEIDTRIAASELAFRMQTSVPDLANLSSEPKSVLDAYGANPGERSFGRNCLMARRLVERGVRFVQLYHRGWDHHGNTSDLDLITGLPTLCRETDQAAAALVLDLKQRGLLDSTLVIWGGEFGRTPMNEGRGGSPLLGRDHHPKAFTMWFAGGGIKPGITLGATDEIGYAPVEDPHDVNDFHATMLHLLGLDHLKLTVRFQGRDFRLTDTGGNVIKKLLA